MYEPPINPVGNSLRLRPTSTPSLQSQTVDARSVSLFDSLLDVTNVPATVLPPPQLAEPQAQVPTEQSDEVEPAESAKQTDQSDDEVPAGTDLAFLTQETLVTQQPTDAVSQPTDDLSEQLNSASADTAPKSDTSLPDSSLLDSATEIAHPEALTEIAPETATPVLATAEAPETTNEIEVDTPILSATSPSDKSKNQTSQGNVKPVSPAESTEEQITPTKVAASETAILPSSTAEEDPTSRRGSSRNRDKGKSTRVTNEHDIDPRLARQIDPSPAPEKATDPATVKVEETLLPSQESPLESSTSTTNTQGNSPPPLTQSSTQNVRPEFAVTAAALNGSSNQTPTSQATGNKGTANNTVDAIMGRSPATNAPAGKSVTSKDDAAAADPQEAVDRAKLVRRVTRAFQKLGDVGGTVRVRLSPPNLGTVRIEVQVEGSHMKARLTAETEGVRAIIHDQLGDLRARLAEQGIQVDKIEVDTEASTADNSMHYRDQSDQRQGETFSPPRRFDRLRNTPPTSEHRPQVLGATSLGWRGDGISVDIHA